MPNAANDPRARRSGGHSCTAATSCVGAPSRPSAWGRPRCWQPAPTTRHRAVRRASGDYPLARPDNPVTLPIFDDNQPIADGLEPEKADALRVLNYADYMAPGVMKDFEEKYGAEVQVTPYVNYDEMLTKISAPGAEFDVVFPGPSVLSRMVYGKLLQPLNQSYLTEPEERLARVPRPLVRPGLAVHRALHRLHHRRRLPRRPGQRPVRGLQDALEPRVRRQDGRARRRR